VVVAEVRGAKDTQEEFRRSGEGGGADVLSTDRAGAYAGENLGRVVLGGLAGGLVDEVGDEFGQRLPLIGEGGARSGKLGSEAGTAGRGVRLRPVSAQNSAYSSGSKRATMV
jgi:hypothetical protein